MCGNFENVPNSRFILEEHKLRSTDQPRYARQASGNLCCSQIFKTQVLVSFLKIDNFFIRHFLANECFRDVRVTSNSIEAVGPGESRVEEEQRGDQNDRKFHVAT